MFSKRFYAATKEYTTFERHVPAPYMRRSFFVQGACRKAELTVCGLGFYQVYINGKHITKGHMAPYISNPDEWVYYDQYDLTPLLSPGKNVLAFLLGNGMQNCPGGQIWDFEKAPFRGAPKVAFALELSDEAGEHCIEADAQLLTHPSPICFDDLRAGEIYDATKRLDGWNTVALDDSGWQPAIPAPTPGGTPRLCRVPPIRVIEERAPTAIRAACIGSYNCPDERLPVHLPHDPEGGRGILYDFGVNMAGIVRLRVQGKAGQRLVLQFGEALDENGNLDLHEMNFLPTAYNHRLEYILHGGEQELYCPSFTYFGFRFCLVMGLMPEQATEELLTFLVMTSAGETRGSFDCSDPLLVRLYENIRRANLSNFFYFPTDCPHREKNGWTADAALSAPQMLASLCVEDSLAEWMYGIRGAQRADGALPGIVPTTGWGFAWGNGPAWDSVICQLPYAIWQATGDRRPIEENTHALLLYLRYMASRRSADGTLCFGLGDWCQVNRSSSDFQAPLAVTDTLYGMDIARKAAMSFAATGHSEAQAEARALYDALYRAAREHLLEADGCTVSGHCQTSQAMGLYYGLFEDKELPKARQVLVSLIEDAQGHMDVGVLGGRVLFRVLTQMGRTDLAYRMVTVPTFPSYAYQMQAQDATALFEAFYPHGCDTIGSRNHHFWGDIGLWMVEALAGLCLSHDSTGAPHLTVYPHPVAALDHASATAACALGAIHVSWHREGEGIRLLVNAPVGLQRTILPPEGYGLCPRTETAEGILCLPLKQA